MKKLTRIVIALVLCLGVVACSSSSDKKDTEGKTVLTFWGHQNDAWSESYKEIAKRFEEENPDITIEFEFFPYDQFQSKVQTSLMSKEGGADIYELWGGWGIDFAPTGSLAAIPESLQKNIEENYYEPTYGSLKHEDKIYGFPLEYNIEFGMVVNDAILKEKNLSVPTTWEELRETARKATVVDGDTFTTKGFDFVNWDSVTYLFTSMIMSQDAKYQNEDGTFNVTSPEAVKAYTELHDMVAVDKVTNMEGLTGGGDLEGYQQLFAGNVAMVPRGPWTIAEGEFSFGLEYGKDFEYAELPFYSNTKSFASETGWSLAINNSSKKQEAAGKFLEFFAQEKNLLNHNVACSQIPADRNVATDPSFVKKMKQAEPLIGILDDGHFIGYFNTDIFKEKINENFTDYVSGKYKTAEEALKALETELNKELAK